MRARDFIFKNRPIWESPTFDLKLQAVQDKYNQAIHIRDVSCQDIDRTGACVGYKNRAQEIANELAELHQMASEFKSDLLAARKQGNKATRANQERIKRDMMAKISKLVNRFSIQLGGETSYVNSVRGIFDFKGAIVNGKWKALTQKQIKDFVDDALEGHIIDMPALVNSKSGSINNFIHDKHQLVWDARTEDGEGNTIGQDFMNMKDPNATRGSIGPAEIAFILLGSPTEKANKGDLKIQTADGEKHYEVKASKISQTTTVNKKTGTTSTKSSKSGGRLTADTMPKNTSIKDDVRKLLMKHFNINLTVAKKFSLSQRGLELLNNLSAQWAKNSRVGPDRRARKVKIFLFAFMKEAMPGFKKSAEFDKGRGDEELIPIINNMVDPTTGEVDINIDGNFMQQYMAANWIEYRGAGSSGEDLIMPKVDDAGNEIERKKNEDGSIEHDEPLNKGGDSHFFDALLFVNRSSMTYLVISSAEDLVTAIQNKQVKITSGATFTDAQNPAAPQLFTH